MSPIDLTDWLSLCQTQSSMDGEVVFEAQGPLKCPPWARGVYGGQLIAQALLAAFYTTGDNFIAHSIHCRFLRPASLDQALRYVVHVAHDGHNFTTRTVHAQQQGHTVMSATASFGRKKQPRSRQLRHEPAMPADELPPADLGDVKQSAAGQAGPDQPCDCVRSSSLKEGPLHERKLRQWIRVRRLSGYEQRGCYKLEPQWV